MLPRRRCRPALHCVIITICNPLHTSPTGAQPASLGVTFLRSHAFVARTLVINGGIADRRAASGSAMHRVN